VPDKDDTPFERLWADNDTERALSEPALVVDVDGFEGPLDLLLHLARNQKAMLNQFKGLYDQAEADRAHIRVTLGTLSATVDRVTSLNGGHLHRQLDNLAVLLADAGPARPEAKAGVLARLFGGGGTSGVRQELRRMMLSQRQMTRQQGETLDARLAQMEADRVEERDALGRLVALSTDQQARLEALIAYAESVDPDGLPGMEELNGARREIVGEPSMTVTVLRPPLAT